MTLLVTVFIGAAIGGVLAPAAVWFSIWYRGRRTVALAAEASRLGFRFSPSDAHLSRTADVPRVAFDLLDRRSATTANVLSGSLSGVAIKAFDFSFKTGLAGDKTQYLSCVIAALPAPGPSVTIERETVASKALNLLGVRDVRVGDAEFDGLFKVKTDDPAEVVGFLVSGLRRWLIAQPADLSFEVRGWKVLACGRQRPPREIEPLLGVVRRFVQLVPTRALTVAQEDAAAQARAVVGSLTPVRELPAMAQLQFAAWIGVILGAAVALLGAVAQRFPM